MTDILMIEGADKFHGAPKDWKPEHGTCSTLPTKTILNDGRSWDVSAWEISDDERAAIAAGAALFLWVSAPFHPVVAITVQNVDYREKPKEEEA